ncbi:pentatricopeptide repeat domain-containing protein [Colletotrichum kahawae]|uniref:Pentatricopeptide repeat domain-containing protein n=1 Tax=Colletotrichum kahawae TaxID=34407 RepID=A0AAD9YE27_COLKA|nr:pentatricopeptide repeat domain-containing protein [Colletotrichum kahawae]
MSLGIAQAWRARSYRTGVSGISLIPRGPPRWSRAPIAQPLPPSYRWIHAASGAAVKPNLDDTIPSSDSKEAGEIIDRKTSDPAADVTEAAPVVEAGTLAPKGRTEEKFQNKSGDRAFDTLVRDGILSEPNVPHGLFSTRDANTQKGLPTQNVPINTSQSGIWRRTTDRRHSPLENGPKGVEQKARGRRGSTSPVQRKHESVLVESPIGYKPPRETMSSLNRHHRSLTRQSRLETIREIKKEPVGNWRSILEVLRRWTRPIKGPWQECARRISVCEEVAMALLYNPDQTIWDIHERTRCHIQLHWVPWNKLKGEKSPSARPFLLLSGDDRAMANAVAEVRRVAGNGNSSSELAVTSNSPQTPGPGSMPSTTVWSSLYKAQRPSRINTYTLEAPFEKIPKPITWTPQTFEAYITAIAKAKLSPRLAQRFYGSGVGAMTAAFDLLCNTFKDVTARHALSTRAFKVALQAVEVHGHSYRHHARDLFRSMCNMGVPLDTEVFNILLKGTTVVKDLGNFDRVVSLMVGNGCAPNIDTWCLVLSMMQDWQVRRHIIKTMDVCGMLVEPGGPQRIAKELAVWDVRQHQPEWTGIKDFLQAQEGRYGRKWATLSAVNKILVEIGRMGHLDDALEFLDIMRNTCDIRPSTLSINILVYHARLQRKPEAAIPALRRAHEWQIPLDETIYHELFKLMTVLRKPNMMGIVWRYAALNGTTSWDMRRDVSELMMRTGTFQSGDNVAATQDPPAVTVTFHEESMTRHLEATLNPLKRAAKISNLLYGWNEGWEPALPLYEILEKAWVADNKIYQEIKEADRQKKQQQAISADSGAGPAPLPGAATPSGSPNPVDVGTLAEPTAPTPATPPTIHRVTKRGIPIVLERKCTEDRGEAERRTLEMTLTHISTQKPVFIRPKKAVQLPYKNIVA